MLFDTIVPAGAVASQDHNAALHSNIDDLYERVTGLAVTDY